MASASRAAAKQWPQSEQQVPSRLAAQIKWIILIILDYILGWKKQEWYQKSHFTRESYFSPWHIVESQINRQWDPELSD